MLISINITGDIKGLETEWLAFQARACGSFYQTWQWCSVWQEQVGARRGTEPVIVTGRAGDGALAFLLPLAFNRRNGVLALEWLAMAQSSYGYGLYSADFLPVAANWFATEGWSVIAKLKRFDVIHLRDLPQRMHGQDHPLRAWFTLRGRNHSYVMDLKSDYEALYQAKRSSETRRGNRKRDTKLAAVGQLGFGLPASRAEAGQLLETMFAQQRDRLAESGIHGVFGRLERAFVHALLDLPAPMQPVLLPYHLTVDGKMEAMMLGGNYGGTYWALISSLGAGEARRYSPGDAALRRTIEACCAAGMTRLDFSSGDTTYKQQWADDIIPLYDIVRARTARGAVWSAAMIAALAAKRTIKQTPFLWNLATKLRKTRASED